MATAPLLLLIVAAVPPGLAADAPALPAGACGSSLSASSLATPVEAAPPRSCAVVDVADDERPAQRALSLAPARVSKRPAREPLIAALETPPLDPDLAPALAPRTEPCCARGPPA